MQLTLYLFREEVKKFEDAMKAELLRGKYKRCDVNDFPFEAMAYVLYPSFTGMRWAGFFADAVDYDSSKMKNSRCGLVFLTKYKDRIFAITAGMGFSAINRDKIEYDFGLKVALNELDHDKILGVDSRSCELNAVQKREISSIEGRFEEFGFDSYTDMLSRVLGKAEASALARTVVGSDALIINDKMKMSDVPGKIRKSYKLYGSEKYKERYAFIDNVKLVKSKARRDVLTEKMVDSIRNYKENKVVLVAPDIDIAVNAAAYRVSCGRERVDFSDVKEDGVLDFVVSMLKGGAGLDSCFIDALDADGGTVAGKRRIKDYISCEVEESGDYFLFADRRWYRVSSDFAVDIDEEIGAINILKNYMPDVKVFGDKTETEGEYNKRATKIIGGVLFDRDLHYTDKSGGSIEMCDIFGNDGKIIHVKKYGSSSVLSHLFNQGYVSAETLRRDRSSEEWFVNRIKEKGGCVPDGGFGESKNIKIVYAIVGARKGATLQTLPFFSKVSLKSFYDRLRVMGCMLDVTMSFMK
jgi:uncharacterized protein (TIGR04141 family)